MNDIDILAAFIARERPGARLVRDMKLPGGSVVALTAVETGRLAGFLTWEEDRPIGRIIRATRESVKHLHETWVVTSLMGGRLLKGEVPGEAGIRVVREGTTQPAVAHPATVVTPAVAQLVELLAHEERLEMAGKLGVSDAVLAVAAGGQLKWGSARFREMLVDLVGDRVPRDPRPTPAEILIAAKPHPALAPVVQL
jgi:hypothetical protein